MTQDPADLARMAEEVTPQQARARFERKNPKLIWPLAVALSMSGGLLLLVASFVGVW